MTRGSSHSYRKEVIITRMDRGLREFNALLDRIPLSQPVRLIGLSASGLGPATAGQLPLLGVDPTRRARLAQAMDRVIARWGEGSLRPSVLTVAS